MMICGNSERHYNITIYKTLDYAAMLPLTNRYFVPFKFSIGTTCEKTLSKLSKAESRSSLV